MESEKNYIKNRKEFERLRESKLALDILEKTLNSVNPVEIMHEKVKLYNNSLEINGRRIDISNKNIHIMGAGKSSVSMALALEEILKEKITWGCINTNEKTTKLKKIKVNNATHPLPSKESINSTKKMIFELKKKVKKDDIILFLLSGGASSMLALPPEEIAEKDFIEMHEILVKSGLPIDKMNAVRKYISKIKGGKLARMFENTIYTLILSDIKSGDLASVGSGPTDYNNSTISDVQEIISKLKKQKIKIPATVEKYLNILSKKKHDETAKIMPENSELFLLGDANLLLERASEFVKSKHLRLKTISQDYNELNSLSEEMSSAIQSEKKRPCIFISTGEPVITIPQTAGKGGRNQHLVLSLLKGMKTVKEPWSILSFNTDGNDFINGIGGALVDSSMIEKHINTQNISCEEFYEQIEKNLKNFNSYELLSKMNALLKSDNTSINFSDIFIAVLGIKNNKRKNNPRKYNKRS